MPELNVVYIAGFNVDKNTGRNKATREKAAALQGLPGVGQFRFMYPGSSRFRLVAYLKALFFDLLVLWRMFFVDKNARIIQRTTFLPLTNIFLRLRGLSLTYELHTDFKEEIQYYHVSCLEKLVLHGYVFFERLNLRLAKAVIYNHPVLQETMSLKYKKPSIYTYNGANVHDLVPMDKMNCRDELSLDREMNYYVFVGSIARWRGVDLLVDIFNGHMGADDVLLIVGNSAHRYGRKLRDRAAGNARIIFKDEVQVGEVVKYINAADVCLVPVKPVLTSPGNPLKLYDYISCGKPVIGQEGVIGCADEIIKYEVGIVTNFFSASRAAVEMREFCLKQDAEFFRVNNRRVAVEEVSWEKKMGEWVKFLTATGTTTESI